MTNYIFLIFVNFRVGVANQFPQKFVSRRNCGSGFETRSYCFEISTIRYWSSLFRV